MNLAELVKEVREKRGLSRRELAKILGRSESSICRWELGNRNPSGGDLVLLLKMNKNGGLEFNKLTAWGIESGRKEVVDWINRNGGLFCAGHLKANWQAKLKEWGIE